MEKLLKDIKDILLQEDTKYYLLGILLVEITIIAGIMLALMMA